MGDGNEFHLSPHRFKGDDEWGVLGGFLLKPLVSSEFVTESDLDEDEVALLAVESARVRRRGVRYSSGVNEVGGGAVSRPEKGSPGSRGVVSSPGCGSGPLCIQNLRPWWLDRIFGLGDICGFAVSSFDFR